MPEAALAEAAPVWPQKSDGAYGLDDSLLMKRPVGSYCERSFEGDMSSCVHLSEPIAEAFARCIGELVLSVYSPVTVEKVPGTCILVVESSPTRVHGLKLPLYVGNPWRTRYLPRAAFIYNCPRREQRDSWV